LKSSTWKKGNLEIVFFVAVFIEKYFLMVKIQNEMMCGKKNPSIAN